MNICFYAKRGCPSPSDGCDAEGIKKCGEVERRRKLAEEDCPAMVANGYSGTPAAKCDLLLFREITPLNIPCYFEGKCLLIKVPKISSYIASDPMLAKLNKLSKEDLDDIAADIKRELIGHKMPLIPGNCSILPLATAS